MTMGRGQRILSATAEALQSPSSMLRSETEMQDTAHNYGPESPEPASHAQVLSVSDLTRCIRAAIEAEDLFRDVWVRGEISNLTRHASGHVYFCLKDESALIRCVVWQSNTHSIRFDLRDGVAVVVQGRVAVYEKQGQYQLVLSRIMPDGVGTLYIAYEELKRRLQSEGLFDKSRKQAIPRFPRRIAIVTSPTAAALRDMVTIARRRMPSINILIVPALMQGTGSEASVVESLRVADSLPGIDAIVLGRGGGSIEDLCAFNSEPVVRAIAACDTPLVSAIGHETDYTLSDFAADLRAPTPSAAIELIVPDRQELAARIRALTDAIVGAADALLARKHADLDMLAGSPSLKYPERMLQARWQSLDLAEERLENNSRTILSSCERGLAEITGRLESLSPLGVLARGYGIVRHLKDGSTIRHVSDVASADMTETLISGGKLISEVKEVREGWD